MTDGFRRFNTNVIVPVAMALMVLGFVALCQPWFLTLHEYSVAITLLGLVLFSVFARFGPAGKA